MLVEALRNKTPAQGIDVNPLAILISKVKTTYVSQEELTKSLQLILEGYKKIYVGHTNFPKEYKIDYWFKPESIEALAKLSTIINGIEEQTVKDVYKLIFSATVRDVSLTYRGEIRLRRLQGEDLVKFNPNVIEKFVERSKLTIDRVSALPREHIIKADIGNAMNMQFDYDQFSAIACSPPYGDDRNGVGYFQFSKNMLFWLGYSDQDIKKYKQMFLGEVKIDKIAPPSMTLDKVIELIKKNPIKSNPKAIHECVTFYQDYYKALKEMTRVCSGKIAIVVGNRILSKTKIDNAQITTELMKNLDYKLSNYFKRRIDKKRIAVMQPGGGSRDTSGGGLINIEHTLIYEQK